MIKKFTNINKYNFPNREGGMAAISASVTRKDPGMISLFGFCFLLAPISLFAGGIGLGLGAGLGLAPPWWMVLANLMMLCLALPLWFYLLHLYMRPRVTA
jgi:Na+-translocating ferredoxin:NAD+ oxidoreductase RnfE subunit